MSDDKQTPPDKKDEATAAKTSARAKRAAVGREEGNEPPPEESRRVISKLVAGLQEEMGKVLRSALERNPVGQESIDRLVDTFIRLLNRREFLERVLHSEFMKNLRDMQSEFTEALGIASQADVVAMREQLDDVTQRLERLQQTLDDIVVEVEVEPPNTSTDNA